MVDSEGLVVRWNRAAESVFGATPQDVLGQSLSAIWPDGEGAAAFLGTEGSTDESSTVVQWRRADGVPITVDVRRTPVVAADGSLIGVLTNARPRTLGSRLSDRLRESEERFRLSFVHSPIGKAIVGQDGRFLSVNSALCDLLGMTEGELLEKPFQEAFAEASLGEDVESARRLRRGDIPRYQNEKRYIRRDGTGIWLEVHVTLVRNRAGDPLYYIAQLYDITERREHAAATEALNEQLRLAEETRTRFLANISHELQSPLTVILGYADLLAESDDPPDAQTLAAAVDAISRQAGRLKRLVSDLVALSRLEAGLSLEPHDVELTGLLEQVLQDCATDRDCWTLQAPDDVHAFADPDRLAQIVANLVGNAEQYGRPPFVVSIEPAPETAAITVADHGDGVPDDFLPFLFNRFARSDRSRQTEGSGLGLAISQGLARAQGGDLEYRAHEPKGSRFIITVPRARSAGEPTATG